MFPLKELADGDRLRELRNYDQAKPPPGPNGRDFYRSSGRLEAAVAKAAKCKDPSFSIAPYQLPQPMSFGGGPANDSRPLLAPVLSAILKAQKLIPDTSYRAKMDEAVDLGDHTTHDPDTLHPRFLEYVHERTVSVDPALADSVDAAKWLRHQHWKALGVSATARPLSDAEPQALAGIIKKGSAGEYRTLGAVDRRDPRLVETMSGSLLRYAQVGELVSKGRRRPAWVDTTLQPTLTFGKDEAKSAKRDDKGNRVPPIPRFIFNLSPINYALGAFLHSDMSHELQRKDLTHGPGFGPSRGMSDLFLNMVSDTFGDRTVLSEDEYMVMSDIYKWDAYFPEALITAVFDMIESYVDCSSLSPSARAARAAMSDVARRQLLHKLVERPSGYFGESKGCMPSGSFYTSFVNTEGNNLLLLSHVIDRASKETAWTARGAAEHILSESPNAYASYGDNQLFSHKLFKIFGLTYDPDQHAAHLAAFGMKLKVDETEVTRELGRVRFCSRAVVRTPEGLLVTRTHTSLAAKLAGRPEHDPLVDKLYVRAMMADHLGTDPITYDLLARVDRTIAIDIKPDSIPPKASDIIARAAKSLLGDNSDDSMATVMRALATNTVNRRALLSLHTRKGTVGKDGKLGQTLIGASTLFGGPLTPAANWALSCTPKEWGRYLKDTRQLGVLYD
nr:RNA-dependent RNA polymerase [Talaromyces amestolkiae polymycovirus 1]